MLDSFVEDFLKSYKPKQLDLSPYLKLDKLKDYRFMEKSDDKLNLIPGETYIKYINRSANRKLRNKRRVYLTI